MADVVAAEGPNLANMQAFPNLQIEAFPATDLDPKKNAGCSGSPIEPGIWQYRQQTLLYKITWSGNKATISEAQSIPFSKTYRADGCPRSFKRFSGALD